MKPFVIYLILILGAVIICVLVIDREGDEPAADATEKTQSPEKDTEKAANGTMEWAPKPPKVPDQKDTRVPKAAPLPVPATADPIPEEIPVQNVPQKKDYYSEVLGLEGDALKEGLHQLIRRHRALTYGELWDALTDLEASGNGKVMLIYSRVARAASQHGGDHGEWNREHLWPRAYGISRSSTANTDLHHIRASDVKVNADRGHLYFDETEGDTSPGNSYSADDDSWEPPREVKGDIARALFYMAVRYEGNEQNEADLELANTPDISKRSHGKLSVLLEWHRLDPVSAEEKARNAKIFRNYQGNRNPFVDHPEFAQRVFSRP